MPSVKRGLGRGLDSLFANTGGEVSDNKETVEKGITTLLLRDIEPDKNQPRKEFEEKSLAELSESIEKHGILQPIVVRPTEIGNYKIIAGERRWRAARKAGLKEVPVIIKDIEDREAMELALIENLQREDLDLLEEAMGYKQLIDKYKFTQEQVAIKVSKSRSAVTNSLRILSLPTDVIGHLRENKISMGHAKAILSLENEGLQIEAAQKIINDSLNVRQAESLCKKMQTLSKMPSKKKSKKSRPSIVAEAEISLQETLGTKVNIKYDDDGKGILNIHFNSLEQLKSLSHLLGRYEK